MLVCTGVSFSQTEIHSGIIHTQSSTEEFNLIKLHFNGFDSRATVNSIYEEFAKYPEFINSCKVVDDKIYVKYTNGTQPNFLLGILNRVSIDVFYMDNGVEVRYEKNPNDNFKR